MNTDLLKSTASNLPTLTYSVLVEAEKDEGYKATVLGLPDCNANGVTREEALINLRQLLTTRLLNSEIVSLEIDNPNFEHPWMKFAGMFKDDPQFDEMQEDIKALRRERDLEMEEYYRQLDTEDKTK
ncbi:MAG: type II toxin-antitoxin system HicB family antitoxin [Rhizonema sp. PD38]|nr:type II toxin-antitoxin system HicB family antitoxin [Rhizonema sp. PD38]